MDSTRRPAASAEGHAHADFVGTLAERVADRAVDPDDRDEEAGRGKQHGPGAPRAQLVRQIVRYHVDDRFSQTAKGVAQLGPEPLNHDQRLTRSVAPQT
jgi:hypothetical protein